MRFPAKRTSVTAIILTAAILCMALFAPVYADEEVFAEAKMETGTAYFTDVTESDWYYDEVSALKTVGIIDGYPDGTFLPNGNITYAEFTKLLITAMHLPVELAQQPEEAGKHWSNSYVTAAVDAGIVSDMELDEGIFLYDEPVSRAYMTKMLICALHIDTALIDNPFTDISDMYAATAYNEYLIRGYPVENSGREFRGDSNATRAEAASIIVRAMAYSDDPDAYKREAVLENAAQNLLAAESEFIDLICVLGRTLTTEFTFMTALDFDTWVTYIRQAEMMYPDILLYSGYGITIADTVCTLTFAYPLEMESMQELKRQTEEKADAIAALLFTQEMTDTDKIKAAHDYIVLNCEYDYTNYINGTIPYESYTAYGAFINKTAVCQGYAAAFNMLCERAGVRCVSISGTDTATNLSHGWNAVLADGVLYFIDVTSDDPVPNQPGNVSYTHYMLTAAEYEALGYVWDKTTVNIKYFY